MSAPFSRIIVIVLDSVGAGALTDASMYGDEGSNTLGNIARQVPLRLPTLRSLGLDRIVDIGGPVSADVPAAAIGRMAEASKGKDSVTGHWEMMGIVLDRPFPVFPNGFPKELIDAFEQRIGRGTLGNYAASGTTIIDELGAEHMRTGKPIVYTSADSVFQIAAHEDVIPIDEQYRINSIAFDLMVGGHGLGRVIARPFVGEARTLYAHGQSQGFCDDADGGNGARSSEGRRTFPVVAIGKIDDLFAGRGITRAIHTKSDDEGVDVVSTEMASTPRGLIFANLVDFDTLVRASERRARLRRQPGALRRPAQGSAAAPASTTI